MLCCIIFKQSAIELLCMLEVGPMRWMANPPKVIQHAKEAKARLEEL